MDIRVTRKQFLQGATKSLVAAGVGAIGANALAQTPQTPITAQAAASYSWPWPYTALDPEDIRDRGHSAYYVGGCAYGAFNAIVSALAAKIGEPYTTMPTQIMYFGGGGGAGWGTLCGALNGAALAIGLTVDRTNTTALVGELFGWYTQVQFPSDISNQRAVQHSFANTSYDKTLPQSVSDSPLCHASVSVWSTSSGLSAGGTQRAERCARLTGDVAAQAVTYLNAFKGGYFKASFVAAQDVSQCMGCHNTSVLSNVVSSVKMDCQVCHKESWEHWYTLPKTAVTHKAR